MKNTTPSPLKGNGLVELIRMGNSIQLKYVKDISCKRCIQSAYHARIQRGGDRWSGLSPPGKSQKYNIFSNTGPDPLPLENHKATKPAFIVGLSLAR